MADFRYGFFVRPNNKKVEPNPEEKSKTSHISDPKSKPTPLDIEGRRQQQPTPVLPRTRFVTKTEKYTEEVYSSSRNNPRPPLNHQQPIEFNKLIAKAQQEARQLKHEMKLSEPMNDIGKAIEYLKEAVSAKNNACSAQSDHHKDGCIKTIDSKEAARRYGKFGAPASAASGAYVATIDCKEAARKYKGTTV